MNETKMKGILSGILLTGILGMVVMSCDPSGKYEDQEKDDIKSFISTLGDTIYEVKPSGLYYINLSEGTGIMPVELDTVSIWFRGMFLNYNYFDSNIGMAAPLTFIVGSGYIIKGIDEGVRYMKEGGKAKLLTPSSLAYGTYGIYGYLGGYTPLLWEVELADVKPGSKK